MPVTRVVNKKSIIMAKAAKKLKEEGVIKPDLEETVITEEAEEVVDAVEEERADQQWDEKLDLNPNDQQKNERL